MGSVTDPNYKRDWMREFRKRQRERGASKPLPDHRRETRYCTLDAIAWLARKRRGLMDVYSYASRLPLDRWAKKDGYSIDEIIRTLKLEIECSSQSR